MNFFKSIFFLILIFSSRLYGTEAIGFYSDGKLKNGESILEKGFLIHKLFLKREKFYGTNELNTVIGDAADFVRQEYPNAELVQLGDLSGKEGGLCKGHASHQNGLDVDIVYLTNNAKLQSQNADYWEEDFVSNGVISKNLNVERNLSLFKFLVTTKPVERIFVDEAIKKKMCQYAKTQGLINNPEIKETLRRLRIQKLHSTHFHIRLKCPETDYSCKSQAEVPEGSGC